LELVERPTPSPRRGEVLVRVAAISFNRRDLMIIKGQYNPKMRLPRIPWSQAGAALARMDEGSHFGKLVLTVG